jgi:hypothetical protein
MSTAVHPFEFSTHPRMLDRALRARRISRDEFVLLVALYARADRATWTVSRSLDQIADLVAWDKSEDYLYRLLAGLRKRGWLDYPTTPGKKAHLYVIRLLHDRSEHSEESPRTAGAASPSMAAAENGSGARIPVCALAVESEDGNERTSVASPRMALPSPRMGATAKPLGERDSDAREQAPVRAPRDVGERANLAVRERLQGERLGTSGHSTVDGEGTAPEPPLWQTYSPPRPPARGTSTTNIGDEGYVAFVRKAYTGGHITHGELLARLRVHGWLIRRTQPASENALVQAVIDTFDAVEVRTRYSDSSRRERCSP